jgi:hypothetical protein
MLKENHDRVNQQIEPFEAGTPSGASLPKPAKSDAEASRGRTHSETAMLQRILVMKEGTTEIDWPKTLNARRQMQLAFERRNAVNNRSYR